MIGEITVFCSLNSMIRFLMVDRICVFYDGDLIIGILSPLSLPVAGRERS